MAGRWRSGSGCRGCRRTGGGGRWPRAAGRRWPPGAPAGPVQAHRGPGTRAGGGTGCRPGHLGLGGPVLDAGPDRGAGVAAVQGGVHAGRAGCAAAPARVERAGPGAAGGRAGRGGAREVEGGGLARGKKTAADLGAWLVFEDESDSWSEATGRTVVVAHAPSQDVRVDRFGDPLVSASGLVLVDHRPCWASRDFFISQRVITTASGSTRPASIKSIAVKFDGCSAIPSCSPDRADLRLVRIMAWFEEPHSGQVTISLSRYAVLASRAGRHGGQVTVTTRRGRVLGTERGSWPHSRPTSPRKSRN